MNLFGRKKSAPTVTITTVKTPPPPSVWVGEPPVGGTIEQCLEYAHRTIEPLEDGAMLICDAFAPMIKVGGLWFYVGDESRYYGTHVQYMAVINHFANRMRDGHYWSVY